jgi:zinc and cadmium transporter
VGSTTEIWWWVMAMVVLDGAAGLAGAAIPERWLERYRAPMLGFATGAVLASGTGEVLPEAVHLAGWGVLVWAGASVFVLGVAEAAVRRRRGPVTPIALLGSDALHNIGDGMAIAAAFLVSIHLGAVTSFAVIVHEVPEEIADYALLRASDIGKRNAVLALAAVQLTAAIGAVGTLVASTAIARSEPTIMAIAGGTFAYIAIVDLVPELVRMRKLSALIAGIVGAACVLAAP